MSNKKVLNGTEGLFLVFYTFALIFFSYLLIKSFTEHSSALEVLRLFLWIVFALSQIVLQRSNLAGLASENQETNRVSSQEWRVKKLPGIIVIVIFCILGVLISVTLATNTEIASTQIVIEPKFEPLEIWSSILLALALTLQTLGELFEITQNLVKKSLALCNGIIILGAFIIYLIYLTHITEVVQ